MLECKGMHYRSQAATRLRGGRHPDDNTNLAMQPRRLTRIDVGLDIWNGTPPSQTEVDCKSGACDDTDPDAVGVLGSTWQLADAHPCQFTSSLDNMSSITRGEAMHSVQLALLCAALCSRDSGG